MRISFSLALVALACAACPAERACAQGAYSGKTVYGMFGPRVLGETLQSPVRRTDRGIARDAYGDFVGVNQAHSGRMFGGPATRGPAEVPSPVSPGPESQPSTPIIRPTLPEALEQAPEVPPGPDQWLRSQGVEDDTTPQSPPVGPNLPDSSRAPGPRGGATHPGWAAMVVGFPSSPMATDPFAGRIAMILQRTVQIKKRSPIRVDVKNETAILRGRVATKQDRELAENLVRLEPGIWDVRNELIVEDSAHVAATVLRGK
jgi:hypothetical protein